MNEYFDCLTDEQLERIALGTKIIDATLAQFGLVFRAAEDDEEGTVMLMPVEDACIPQSVEIH